MRLAVARSAIQQFLIVSADCPFSVVDGDGLQNVFRVAISYQSLRLLRESRQFTPWFHLFANIGVVGLSFSTPLPRSIASVYCSIDPAQLAHFLSNCILNWAGRFVKQVDFFVWQESVRQISGETIWQLPRLHHQRFLLRDEFRIFLQSAQDGDGVVNGSRKLVEIFVLKGVFFLYWRYSASVVAPIICQIYHDAGFNILPASILPSLSQRQPWCEFHR